MLLKTKEEEIKVEKEKINNNTREKYWDIIKGIGIISIVIGHISIIADITKFVYAYHLSIFYFVAAYFYDEKKYGDSPFENFSHKLKGIWKKYIFYSVLVILMHNLMMKALCFETAEGYYNIGDIIYQILNASIFNQNEFFARALWFVPTLLISLGIFGIIVYLSRKISYIICNYIIKSQKDEKYIKNILLICFSIINGILGILLSKDNVLLQYHMQTSFLVIPILLIGYYAKVLKKYFDKKNSFLFIIEFIVSALLIWYLVSIKNIHYDLYFEEFDSYLSFYILSIIGIIFCISFAKIIEKNKVCSNLIAFVGKYSFSIMALHFLVIKIIDVIYANIIDEKNMTLIRDTIRAYPEKLWLIYIIVGTLLPAIFAYFFDKIRKKLKSI